ncbi:hypothetical protein, partial [Streptomyces sp. NPDC058295]|uniref:hypothetical protein n=1 Tax=Streptomyces sp. NPDC058295 TaxID=3346431 RepID=UPI0036EC6536
MERESEELAAWAAGVLNRGLLSENREEIRRAFVEWFVRHGGPGSVPAQITSPLDGSDGSEATLVEVEGRHIEAWLLSGKEGALTELFELIDRFEQTPWPPEPTAHRADPTARHADPTAHRADPPAGSSESARQGFGPTARLPDPAAVSSERTARLPDPAAVSSERTAR